MNPTLMRVNEDEDLQKLLKYWAVTEEHERIFILDLENINLESSSKRVRLNKRWLDGFKRM